MSVIDVNQESILPNNTAVCRYNIYLVIKSAYTRVTRTHTDAHAHLREAMQLPARFANYISVALM